jgi:hypothetical protein
VAQKDRLVAQLTRERDAAARTASEAVSRASALVDEAARSSTELRDLKASKTWRAGVAVKRVTRPLLGVRRRARRS